MSSLTPKQRVALITYINALVQFDFESLVFALDVPKSVLPSNSAPQGHRSSALLAWVESPTGCGIVQLIEILRTIAPLPNISISHYLDAHAVSSPASWPVLTENITHVASRARTFQIVLLVITTQMFMLLFLQLVSSNS